jgi:hypothetical protein
MQLSLYRYQNWITDICPGFLFGVDHRSWADNLRIWQEIIWHCCQNDCLFQNKWPKRPTHATHASDTWSSILQFVHNLFWLNLKWNTRSKLFYFIIYRASMLWWSSRTLTKLKSQSQKRFNERNINIWNIRTRITPDRTHKNYRISIWHQI